MLKQILFSHLNLYKWLKKNQSCLLCEGETHHLRGWIFCRGCLADLPWLIDACRQCGIDLAENHKKCDDCLNKQPYFDETVALFAYQRPINRMLIQYKYHGHLYYLPTFADMLALKIFAHYQKYQRALPEVILAVPLGAARLKQRGFNQSLEIAKQLSHILGIPYKAQAIIRLRDTRMQAGLSLKQREVNLQNAFGLGNNPKACRALKNKRVALVDDVLTTGATLDALAKLLKEAGAYSVDNWVIARTLATIS